MGNYSIVFYVLPEFYCFRRFFNSKSSGCEDFDFRGQHFRETCKRAWGRAGSGRECGHVLAVDSKRWGRRESYI